MKKKIENDLIFFKNLKNSTNEKTKQKFVVKYSGKAGNYKFENLIRFIIGISAYRNNVIVYVTDIKGKLRYYKSSGMLGLLKKQRKRSVRVIFKLLKLLISDNKHLKINFANALHLKNINKKMCAIVLNFLSKNSISVKSVRLRNHQPHNGCRPKKIRRKKRKKIFFGTR